MDLEVDLTQPSPTQSRSQSRRESLVFAVLSRRESRAATPVSVSTVEVP